MILIIVLAVLVVAFTFILSRRVGLEADWDDGGFRARVTYMGFSRKLARSGKEKSGEKEKKAEKGRTPTEWVGLIREFLPAARRFLVNLGRFGRFSRLNLTGDYGMEDPYLTGALCGYVEGLKGCLASLVPVARIDLRPDFVEERLDLVGRGRVDIRLGSAIYVAMVTAWYLPKRRIWQLIKRSKN